jgi:hypothetical protein
VLASGVRCGWESLVPVRDSASGQVIGREFQCHSIAVHDLDPIAPESPSHGRQHGLAGFQFDGEHPSLELLDDFSEYFDVVFFGQNCPFKFLFNWQNGESGQDSNRSGWTERSEGCLNRRTVKLHFYRRTRQRNKQTFRAAAGGQATISPPGGQSWLQKRAIVDLYLKLVR